MPALKPWVHLRSVRLRHWSRLETYRDRYEGRAKIAACFIAPGAIVLDIGCGAHMHLRNHIPPECRYVPADLVRWTEDVQVVDLNRGEFPVGVYDYAALLGVVEYLTNPLDVLAHTRAASRHLLVSYRHPRHWLWRPRHFLRTNTLTEQSMSAILGKSGWQVTAKTTIPDKATVHQVLYCAH